jgi:hypothetical protein
MARFDHPTKQSARADNGSWNGTFFPRATSRKLFLHVDDASVGTPEHQIRDSIELDAMRQYHWFGAAARVLRQESECAKLLVTQFCIAFGLCFSARV